MTPETIRPEYRPALAVAARCTKINIGMCAAAVGPNHPLTEYLRTAARDVPLYPRLTQGYLLDTLNRHHDILRIDPRSVDWQTVLHRAAVKDFQGVEAMGALSAIVDYLRYDQVSQDGTTVTFADGLKLPLWVISGGLDFDQRFVRQQLDRRQAFPVYHSKLIKQPIIYLGDEIDHFSQPGLVDAAQWVHDSLASPYFPNRLRPNTDRISALIVGNFQTLYMIHNPNDKRKFFLILPDHPSHRHLNDPAKLAHEWEHTRIPPFKVWSPTAAELAGFCTEYQSREAQARHWRSHELNELQHQTSRSIANRLQIFHPNGENHNHLEASLSASISNAAQTLTREKLACYRRALNYLSATYQQPARAR